MIVNYKLVNSRGTTQKGAWVEGLLMLKLVEGKLEFFFAPGCAVVKYDETEWHRKKFGHFQAMDFLISTAAKHCWVEVKDCIHYSNENQARLSADMSREVRDTNSWVKEKGWEATVSVQRKKPWIVDEVMGKFRATTVGIALAERIQEATLKPYFQWSQSPQMQVILLLTWPISDYKRLAIRLNAKLSQSFLPFNIQTLVINEIEFSNQGYGQVQRLA
jgi:hypothetical protein